MAEKTSTDQYGRKTWNVEVYEEEARRGPKDEGPSDGTLSTIQKLKGQTLLAQRAQLLDTSVSAVGKHTLINGGKSATSVFGKNKRFGFYCSICDLSFRDTLALIDHFNSPQHVANVTKLTGTAENGESLENGIRRATVEEVVSTLEHLVQQSLRANKSSAESLQLRIQKRQEFEEKRALARRQKAKQRRGSAEPATEIGKIMGFDGFGTKR